MNGNIMEKLARKLIAKWLFKKRIITRLEYIKIAHNIF